MMTNIPCVRVEIFLGSVRLSHSGGRWKFVVAVEDHKGGCKLILLTPLDSRPHYQKFRLPYRKNKNLCREKALTPARPHASAAPPAGQETAP